MIRELTVQAHPVMFCQVRFDVLMSQMILFAAPRTTAFQTTGVMASPTISMYAVAERHYWFI